MRRVTAAVLRDAYSGSPDVPGGASRPAPTWGAGPAGGCFRPGGGDPAHSGEASSGVVRASTASAARAARSVSREGEARPSRTALGARWTPAAKDAPGVTAMPRRPAAATKVSARHGSRQVPPAEARVRVGADGEAGEQFRGDALAYGRLLALRGRDPVGRAVGQPAGRRLQGVSGGRPRARSQRRGEPAGERGRGDREARGQARREPLGQAVGEHDPLGGVGGQRRRGVLVQEGPDRVLHRDCADLPQYGGQFGRAAGPAW